MSLRLIANTAGSSVDLDGIESVPPQADVGGNPLPSGFSQMVCRANEGSRLNVITIATLSPVEQARANRSPARS
jgi:hypothetical protein